MKKKRLKKEYTKNIPCRVKFRINRLEMNWNYFILEVEQLKKLNK